jgi:ribosomal subunit interface protein
MQTPLSLTFRHLDSSAAVAARVRELVERLERFHYRIISCDVIVEAPPTHQHKGSPFAVKVELTIPGGVINANSAHGAQPEHADVYVALRDAFDSVKRQLQDEERSN